MSSTQMEDQRLMPIIHEVFLRHRRRYGARRIAEQLEARRELCGIPRVARLMKTLGLFAIQPKRFRPRTTDSRHNLGYSPNLLQLLYRWKSDRVKQGGKTATAMERRIQDLEERLRITERERDILKKALSIFSQRV